MYVYMFARVYVFIYCCIHRRNYSDLLRCCPVRVWICLSCL